MVVPRVVKKSTSKRREGINGKTLRDGQNIARFPKRLKSFLVMKTRPVCILQESKLEFPCSYGPACFSGFSLGNILRSFLWSVSLFTTCRTAMKKFIEFDNINFRLFLLVEGVCTRTVRVWSSSFVFLSLKCLPIDWHCRNPCRLLHTHF